jgi:hypothetical protein
MARLSVVAGGCKNGYPDPYSSGSLAILKLEATWRQNFTDQA